MEPGAPGRAGRRPRPVVLRRDRGRPGEPGSRLPVGARGRARAGHRRPVPRRVARGLATGLLLAVRPQPLSRPRPPGPAAGGHDTPNAGVSPRIRSPLPYRSARAGHTSPDPALFRARRSALGARMRALRRERHLRRRQVAARAGLSPLGYLRLEWGRCFPDLDTAYAVADALGVEI